MLIPHAHAARFALSLFALALAFPAHAGTDLIAWKAQAGQVTITRDDWGIAHVNGRTDADAVFGTIYAQAEEGFNPKAGWMHTSSGVDNVDEFAETIVTAPDGARSYRYGKELRPVTTKTVTIALRAADGTMAKRTFTTYATHHGAIVQTFDDAKPSLSVPFTSAQWGSLASFGAKRYPGTRRYYGTSGNSFVAIVEFGPTVRARAVSAGGENGDSASPHFDDQAQRYADGALREVYFYPAQLTGHVERSYRPGE